MIAKGITLNLGRSAGALEDAKRLWVSAKAGHRDPARAGFWGIDQAADQVAQVVSYLNRREKNGRLQNGAPDEVWARDTAASPLASLDAEKLHVFLPEAREVALRSGSVWAKVGGRIMAWREPELFAALGSGFAVVIKFDPAEPNLGAAIFNREAQTSSANRWGWAVGQFLGLAEFEPEAPQIMARGVVLPEENEESLDRRKRYLSAVRSEYRATFGDGRRTSVAREARNGRGEIVRIETSSGEAASATHVARAVSPAPAHGTPPAPAARATEPQPAPAWRDPIMAQIFGG